MGLFSSIGSALSSFGNSPFAKAIIPNLAIGASTIGSAQKDPLGTISTAVSGFQAGGFAGMGMALGMPAVRNPLGVGAGLPNLGVQSPVPLPGPVLARPSTGPMFGLAMPRPTGGASTKLYASHPYGGSSTALARQDAFDLYMGTGQVARGYHIGRNGFLARNRRMNPLNPRALSRALRRSYAFARFAKKAIRITGPRSPFKRGAIGGRRRRKVC